MPEYVINQYRGVYKRALELYQDEKFKECFPMFETVVKNDPGNYDAYYYLADLLYNGKGCEKDTKSAFQYFITSATNKNVEAAYMVGMCYLTGQGARQDSTQAVAWFTEAAKYAHPLSQYYLGLAYLKGEGIQQDVPRATQWLVHASKAGIVDAQREAGNCYEMLGKMKGAATMYLEGARNGDAVCMEKIADCYADGVGTLQCIGLALHFYEQAAENGNVLAQVKLGKRYLLGKGVEQDVNKAFNWFTKAANAGNPEAENALANCYHMGDGTIKNDTLAINWWSKAAEAGNVDAMTHLAEILTDPTDEYMDPDLAQAKNWWSKAAELGDAYAMYRLGDCLERGIGVSVINVDDAYKWYRLSAQKGNEDAIEACKRFSKGVGGKMKLKKV